jgi:hypothetical protein
MISAALAMLEGQSIGLWPEDGARSDWCMRRKSNMVTREQLEESGSALDLHSRSADPESLSASIALGMSFTDAKSPPLPDATVDALDCHRLWENLLHSKCSPNSSALYAVVPNIYFNSRVFIKRCRLFGCIPSMVAA